MVNIDHLSRLDPEIEITPDYMAEMGLIRDLKYPVKILGRGEIDKALIVGAHRFSRSARLKIENAGGTAKEIRS